MSGAWRLALMLVLASACAADDCGCASIDTGIDSGLIDAAQRPQLDLTIAAELADGRAVRLSEVDKPLAVVFAYTRCANPRKCPAIARGLGGLDRAARAGGLGDRVALALVTYDPEHDTGERLAAFAAACGIDPDGAVLLIRPPTETKAAWFGAIGARVSFNADGVALHASELLLIDARGRLARSRRAVAWDDADVVRDLAALADER